RKVRELLKPKSSSGTFANRVIVREPLTDDRFAARPVKPGAGSIAFFADVSHADRRRQIGWRARASDLADLFACESQKGTGFGRRGTVKGQLHAPPIHLATGAHPLHDLLPGVATLGIADVRVFQPRFMRNLLVAEVVAEPGNAL